MSVKIGVILGSTRPHLLGEKLFKYLQRAMPTTDVNFTWIDLKDYPLLLYDHAIPGSLKNALDFVGPETDHKPVHKPVQIVTYSKYSDGGMLAAASFVEILQMLKMMVLPTPVLLWNTSRSVN